VTNLIEEPWIQKDLEYPGEIGRGVGARGIAKSVKRIQEWLSFHGLVTAIDGDFGPATEKAVLRFQTMQSLPATGTVDKPTFIALTRPLRELLAPILSEPDSLSEAIVEVARRHLQVHPVEIGGPNAGPWVRFYMRGQEGKECLWCAGFACTVLRQASETIGSDLPVTYQTSCDRLAEEAQESQCFLSGGAIEDNRIQVERIKPGSLFLVRNLRNARDWIHTGVVMEANEESFTTIEGNTNSSGSSNGFEVCQRERGYARCDFFLLDT
jgi:hypothetical protein